MTWRKATLAFGSDAAAISCAIIPAHPWVYGLGQQTETGAWLSPVNAVAYLASQLASRGGEAEIIVLMICADAHAGFMQLLDRLTAVFPAPAFTQVTRLAQSVAELNTVKMQLPAKSVALPAAVPLSVPTQRAALAAAKTVAAQAQAAGAIDVASMEKQLAQFAGEHAAVLAEIDRGLAALQAQSAEVWVFTGHGSPANITAEMMKNIPQPSAVHTAAMMFIGDDLTSLRGLIHDKRDGDAGA